MSQQSIDNGGCNKYNVQVICFIELVQIFLLEENVVSKIALTVNV